jgi:hypothetical protein
MVSNENVENVENFPKPFEVAKRRPIIAHGFNRGLVGQKKSSPSRGGRKSPTEISFARLAAPWKSGGGPPQSKTLSRFLVTTEPREASWSAPVLWRFGFLSGRF